MDRGRAALVPYLELDTMTPRIFALATFALLAAFDTTARAGVTTPGSLIVFPAFDNRYHSDGARNLTLFTVTNTHRSESVRVHFVYRNAPDCLETNRSHVLTPNDTLSVITALHNPNRDQGFCYAYAQAVSGPNAGQAIKFDWLIASQMDLRHDLEDARDGDYEFTPYIFRAVGRGLDHGDRTDIDTDGLRDLNGREYERTPDALLVPRFFGQDASDTPEVLPEDYPRFRSELVLINLTGGRLFDATVDFLIYNDNEEVFSAQHAFRCWTRVPLAQINGVFTNDFLKYNTGHAPGEVATNGFPFPETGWFSIDGAIAQSTNTVFVDPAILALRIEVDHTSSHCGGAVLPFCLGTQANGDLLSLSLLGDDDPADNGPNTDPWDQ